MSEVYVFIVKFMDAGMRFFGFRVNQMELTVESELMLEKMNRMMNFDIAHGQIFKQKGTAKGLLRVDSIFRILY